MTTDVASLVLNVDSRQARTATQDLNALARTGGVVQTATSGLTGAFAGLATGLFSVATAGMVLRRAISIQREFDVINAGLITATGSAENAQVAFEALSEFAASTPYDLAQVSDSFIKLVNLGLEPSERAMTSYGNTASAMGKDLNMLVEAVADAATGEFERLKEFGIKARSQGDQVSLTFQGVTTTVGKNAREIEQYLIGIGETNFAGAMAQRMDSLDGKLSNLGDSWDQVFRGIMASDIGDGIESMVDLAIGSLDSLNGYLESGEFEGHLAQMGAAFGPFAEDAQDALDIVWRAIQDHSGNIERHNPELENILTRAWRDFPENVRAVVQLAAVHFAWWVEQARIGAEATKGYLKAITDGIGGLTLEEVYDRGRAAQERNSKTLSESIDLIYEERDATQAAQQAAADKAAADKAEYERKKGQRSEEDRLARYRIGKDGEDGASSGAAAAAEAAAKRQQKQLESLRDHLRTEEEEINESYAQRQAIINASLMKGSEEYERLSQRSAARRDRELAELAESRSRDFDNLSRALMGEEEAIQDSYNRRIAIINESTTVSEEARQRLRDKVEEDRQRELEQYAESQQQKRDQLMQGLLTEQEEIVQYHERRKEEILNATYVTEMERQALLRREEERFMAESANRERQRIAMITSSAGGMFDALGQLVANYAESTGKEQKRLFKLAQAFSLASAIISIATGISKAQELGYPMNIFESVRVAAVGAVQIATIKSQNYAGAYDQGGHIPAGRWGVVGELGPEVVRGPATVTGRELTARHAATAAGSGGRGDVYVSVSVSSDGSGSVSVNAAEQEARQLGQLVGAKVREVLQEEMRTGGMLWRGGVRNG